jgi:hypothetical protein
LRYGRASLTRGFSRQLGLSRFHPVSGSPSLLSSAGLLPPASSPTSLAPALPPAGQPTLLRHPFAQSTSRGTGILTCCPSATPFGLTLGPTNPTRIDLPSETLDFRGLRFSHSSRYSCQHSHFRSLHDSLQYRFNAHGTLAYCSTCPPALLPFCTPNP